MTKPSTSYERLCADLLEGRVGFYFTGSKDRWTAHLRRPSDLQWDLGHGETPQAALDNLYARLDGEGDEDWRSLI